MGLNGASCGGVGDSEFVAMASASRTGRKKVNLAQAVFENLDWIPSHWNNIYVFDVVRRVASVEGNKSMIHFLSDHVVGPAVRKVFAANVLLWSSYLVFP